MRPKMKSVFVTGGAGYIGIHTVICLLEKGINVTILDSLQNSSSKYVDTLQNLILHNRQKLKLVIGDIRDAKVLGEVFETGCFDGVIHFAGLKFPAESYSNPLEYYDCNVNGSISLLKVMGKYGVKTLVFSSSCAVYGPPQYVPIDENHPISPASPYGKTKAIIEDMLQDLSLADAEWKIIILRYFNPAGAHEKGIVGECPHSTASLLPAIQLAALGEKQNLKLFGTDYETMDGTCIRDFIHIMDLAEGHVAALNKLNSPGERCGILNMGTGVGTTVLQLVRAFEQASNMPVPLEYAPRRVGDVVEAWAATHQAEEQLGWKAKRTIADICLHQFNWAQKLREEEIANGLPTR